VVSSDKGLVGEIEICIYIFFLFSASEIVDKLTDISNDIEIPKYHASPHSPKIPESHSTPKLSCFQNIKFFNFLKIQTLKSKKTDEKL
jgi:hypothetical protein